MVDDFPPYPPDRAHERQIAVVELITRYIVAGDQLQLPRLTWTVGTNGSLIAECLFNTPESRSRAFDAWSVYLGGERDDTAIAARSIRYDGEGGLRFAVILVARGYVAS